MLFTVETRVCLNEPEYTEEEPLQMETEWAEGGNFFRKRRTAR